jgi:uncharacterized ion transporter superfamily protein YfcC
MPPSMGALRRRTRYTPLTSSMRHPLALLAACILVAAALTYVIPAGQFDRRDDPKTGRKVVVAGSYHRVEPSPVNPLEALVAVPKGVVDAAAIMALIFFAGSAVAVIDRTGALRTGVSWLAGRLRRRETLIIPIACVVFGTAGAVEGMWEEIVALIPVLLVLSRGVGFDGLTAVSMSLGAAGIGSTFSPANPFGVGIAQRFAELPLLSGWRFRLAVLVPALAMWAWATIRHARRTRTDVDSSIQSIGEPFTVRHVAVLVITVAAFATLVGGAIQLGWSFEEMGAVFLVLAMLAGLVGGLSLTATFHAVGDGFAAMSFAAVLVGVARAVFVVLDEGKIVDTIINALVTPLAQLPLTLYAMGISVVQTLLTVPVPSSTGRVTLTMPILVPLSDLLGLSRQVTVTATQYGPGILNQFMPTDGTVMAVLTLAGVRFESWLRFCLPICALLFAYGLAAVALAAYLNLP